MIGDLSAKYESNGNPNTISSGYGDLGGKSYGCYQFAINAGIPQTFVSWLENKNYDIFSRLSQYEVGTDEFDNEWSSITEGFAELQHAYVKENYFDAAIDNLNSIGFNALEHSEALQQVIWSRAVQYSAHWINSLFQEASAGQSLDAISDHDLIYNIYEYLINDGVNAVDMGNRLYHSPNDWVNGSYDIVKGLINRFHNERDEALAML